MPLSRRSFLAACAVPPALAVAAGEAPAAFAERRRRLAESTGSGVICLLGYDRSEGRSGFTGFRQESNFFYLTGHDEPGAALLIAPAAGRDGYREILFLPRQSEASAMWSGPRRSPGSADGLGFGEVLEAGRLRGELRSLLRDRRRLMGLRPRHPAPPDAVLERASFDRLAQLAGDSGVRDIRGPLAALRSVKSPAEVALLCRAARATESAFRAAWRSVRPGAVERSVAAEFVAEAFRAGCERLAFPPMAGSGPNAAILHYQRNGSVMRDGQLLLLDAGGERSRYAADIARTVPVGGRFTARQRLLYELVLKALRAAIAAARPGIALEGGGPRSLRSVAERVLRSGAPEGVLTHLPHALGHHVGLDVHDPAPPRGAMQAGMVLAVEPGIYLPREGLGIRIEDMIEITPDGSRLLSDGLPAGADGIERALASG